MFFRAKPQTAPEPSILRPQQAKTPLKPSIVKGARSGTLKGPLMEASKATFTGSLSATVFLPPPMTTQARLDRPSMSIEVRPEPWLGREGRGVHGRGV